MDNLDKSFDKKFGATLQQVQPLVGKPYKIAQGKPKEFKDFIHQREKELLEEVEKIEIDIEMAITTNPDYMEMARDRVQSLRRRLSNE